MPDTPEHVFQIDPITFLISLTLDSSLIAYLHALLEAHDDVGVVKTIDESKGHICVLSTTDTLADVLELLDNEREYLSWQPAEKPESIESLFEY